MKHTQIIQLVQDRTAATSAEEAESLIGATLLTLAERLAGGEPHDLASQLPQELQGYMEVSGAEDAQRFGLDEFVQRVVSRAELQHSLGLPDVQATMGVIAEAVTGGEVQDVRSQLGPDFAELFTHPSRSR